MGKQEYGSVTSYDSFEELMADQQRAHDAAMEAMTESQAAIPLGGYAMNLTHLDNPDIGPIYGAVQSVEELRAWHALYAGVGDEATQALARDRLAVRGVFKPPSQIGNGDPSTWLEEGQPSFDAWIEYYEARHVASWKDGYLFGWWFSAAEEGELGSAHKSMCVEISEEVYRDAQAHGGKISVEHAHEVSLAIRKVRDEIKAREGTTEGEGDEHSDR